MVVIIFVFKSNLLTIFDCYLFDKVRTHEFKFYVLVIVVVKKGICVATFAVVFLKRSNCAFSSSCRSFHFVVSFPSSLMQPFLPSFME